MATMVSREPKTISRASRSLASSVCGFTLVEILLVLAIIGMVMAIGLPAISRVTMHRLNSTTRQFVGLIRTIRNDAILLNQTHRLAVNLDKKTYWVEYQTRGGLLSEGPEETKGKKKGEPPPSNFSISGKYSKEPKNLPGGVEFNGVYKEREGNRTEGTVYVHFFPNGFNEQAILYLSKEAAPETTYSLIIRPTSGRVDIVHETVKDFNAPTH